MQAAINHALNSIVTPYITVGPKAISAYRLFGILGFLAGAGWGAWLAAQQGLSAWLFLGLAGAGILTLFGLIVIIKIVTGAEILTSYHDQIASILVVTGILWGLDRPILPYLDAFAVGLGLVIACGRIGCLMVGCCYGSPHNWGVCYRPEHAADGFAPYLVGVRLFPVQLIESGVTWGLVGVCSGLILAGFAPGSALAWYGVAYGTLRFVLEFWRGDNPRPFWAGLSETQWLSLLIVLAIVIFEAAGVFPFFESHLILGPLLLLGTLFLVYRQRRTPMADRNVLHPPHLHEVARILDQDVSLEISRPEAHQIRLSTTSLGIQISSSRLEEKGQPIHHYAFSRQQPVLTAEAAQTLTDLILKLKHRDGFPELIHRREGVFHLLVRSGGSVK